MAAEREAMHANTELMNMKAKNFGELKSQLTRFETLVKKIPKAEMLHPKGASGKKKAGGPKAKVVPKAKPAPKAAPAKAAKAVPKAAPKPAAKPKAKPAQKRAPKAKAPKAKAIKKKSNINPLTQQPYDPNAKQKVSIDNIKRHRKRGKHVLGAW